jgi:hypothetical protein
MTELEKELIETLTALVNHNINHEIREWKRDKSWHPGCIELQDATQLLLSLNVKTNAIVYHDRWMRRYYKPK